jgi:hypothetical protein
VDVEPTTTCKDAFLDCTPEGGVKNARDCVHRSSPLDMVDGMEDGWMEDVLEWMSRDWMVGWVG